MIYYAKYHKDGNSFIITEQQDICGENKKTLAETLCRQDTNIGADSLTVCDTSQHFISMVSYSRNGMRQPLNGNGIACLIQYCYEYGFLLEREAYIKTDAALVGVKIKKTSPFGRKLLYTGIGIHRRNIHRNKLRQNTAYHCKYRKHILGNMV